MVYTLPDWNVDRCGNEQMVFSKKIGSKNDNSRPRMGAAKHISSVLLISIFRKSQNTDFFLAAWLRCTCQIWVWLEDFISCLCGMKISLTEKLRNGAFVTLTHGNVTAANCLATLKWTSHYALRIRTRPQYRGGRRIMWAIGCLAKGITAMQKR